VYRPWDQLVEGVRLGRPGLGASVERDILWMRVADLGFVRPVIYGLG
jgi:hypothetical protein